MWVYPRTHGGTTVAHCEDLCREGLSPHTRGNRPILRLPRRLGGSIPAHTGEPTSRLPSRTVHWVYPRTHGGTRSANSFVRSRSGLSPHTRGNLYFMSPDDIPLRSIPAHTGEPRPVPPRPNRTRVYPRTHGGTSSISCRKSSVSGLSPHTRGNLRVMPDGKRMDGSIPAHTGEPSITPSALRIARVYPRTHGGTARRPIQPWRRRGLSPHTRGNRHETKAETDSLGSIPAHTGEPSSAPPSPATRRVYPRTHGGTIVSFKPAIAATGLSPHTRGNPPRRISTGLSAGSIPAHTGEPRPGCDRSSERKVYPRTHGGTVSAGIHPSWSPGLSPHTRGNRPGPPRRLGRSGSIPAHTGEPTHSTHRPVQIWVYPRTHGGTRSSVESRWSCLGLSPHTRGNRPQVRRFDARVGSIPAHTGEPLSRTPSMPANGVYPRTHGGTRSPNGCLTRIVGLSPHTRGNQERRQGDQGLQGSIPAHTGGPAVKFTRNARRRVYPRTHGGTIFAAINRAGLLGLSPHTRGNLLFASGVHVCPGSIPAHTGEPRTARSRT